MNARPWYATNARNLLDARKHGMVPESQVNVSLIGQPDSNDVTLIVREDMPVDRLDWRMLVNLNVLVISDIETPFIRSQTVLKNIAKCRPAWLQFALLAGDEYHVVDCGSGIHLAAFGEFQGHHDFCWFPMAPKQTPIARRATKALRNLIQPGACL